MHIFNSIFYLNKFILFLIIILPLTLITGPALPDITITFSAIFFLYISFKYKLKNYFFNNIFIYFLIFSLILITSSLFSKFPLYSLFKGESLFFIRFFIFSVSLIYFASINKNLPKYLAYTFLIGILLNVIDGSVQYFSGESLLNIKAGDSRLTALFLDEPIVGRYVSTSTMLFCSLLNFNMVKNSKFTQFIVPIVYIIGCVFTYMTGERVAFGAILLFGILMSFLTPKNIFIKVIILVTIITIVVILNFNFDRSTNRASETINDLNNREFKFMVATPVHDAHYKSALLMFKDNPILGIGSNLFRKFCHLDKYQISIEEYYGQNSCTTHPHNYYFQLLAENGLLGLLGLLFFFFALSLRLLSHFLSIYFKSNKFIRGIKTEFLPFYIFIFVMISPFWPSGNLYSNWTNIPIFIGLGFLLVSVMPLQNIPKKNFDIGIKT